MEGSMSQTKESEFEDNDDDDYKDVGHGKFSK